MQLKDYLGGRHGAQTKLAASLQCPSQLVYQWANKIRPIPTPRCPAIERATNGEVTCEELRPDINWVRLPDPDWTWNAHGRPLIDATQSQLDVPQEEQRNAA